MKLYYSATSPFVRKVMIAAREIGALDRITSVPTAVLPTQPNLDLASRTP
jgi:glutathione S-transferase